MNPGLARYMGKLKPSHGALAMERSAHEFDAPTYKEKLLTLESDKSPIESESTVPVTPEYTLELAAQENQKILELPDDAKIYPNVAPEKGGGKDIGFGHKLTKEELESQMVHGVDISNGITKAEAQLILEKDIEEHVSRVKQHVGEETFEELPTAAKEALVDLSFTGVLAQFKNFKKAIINKDQGLAFKEYKRYFTSSTGQKQEMGRRNDFMESMLQKLVEQDYFKKV